MTTRSPDDLLHLLKRRRQRIAEGLRDIQRSELRPYDDAFAARQPLICTDEPRLHLVREQNDRPFSARMLPDETAMHESRRAP